MNKRQKKKQIKTHLHKDLDEIFKNIFNNLNTKERPKARTELGQELLKKLKELPQDNHQGGIKYDQDKVPLDLIPYEALEEIGKVLAHGMKKYKRANWAGGINYSRLIAAALRHLNQFNAGQDTDNESGLSHVSHAATNLVFLIWMIQHRSDLDDRWIKSIKKFK